ncbi:glycosyltransferase family 32 protein [Mycolicibacterium elephantis]|nr:glycosyltransferase [Mycolicibacterium elephantis]
MSPSEVVDNHRLRSEFMRRLIAATPDPPLGDHKSLPPRILVQFWDDADAVPMDVQECLDSWAVLETLGFQRWLFDDITAARFIAEHFSARHVLAFEKCRHPAMRSDFFRYSFMFQVGGFYVDADDVYLAGPLERLLSDGRLKLQPLCYDIATDSMCDPHRSTLIEEDASLIFYINTTPLIAPAGHPIIADALERATSNILNADEANRDIQSLTGPGNITGCLVRHAIELETSGATRDFEIVDGWTSIAESKWPLAYRSDRRNWRHWEQGDA